MKTWNYKTRISISLFVSKVSFIDLMTAIVSTNNWNICVELFNPIQDGGGGGGGGGKKSPP